MSVIVFLTIFSQSLLHPLIFIQSSACFKFMAIVKSLNLDPFFIFIHLLQTQILFRFLSCALSLFDLISLHHNHHLRSSSFPKSQRRLTLQVAVFVSLIIKHVFFLSFKS